MKTTRFLLAASVSLALTFTFSCSSDDGDGGTLPSSSSGDGSSSSGITYGSLTYEGKDYRTVEIGTQTWMADNLNYDVPDNDTDLCYSDETDRDYCETYGRLYDWETAQTVCPEDWRLPSDDDWDALVSEVGGEATAGIKLKDSSGWDAGPPSKAGTNSSGFSGLPGGGYIPGDDSGFKNVGKYGFWWSSNEDSNVGNGNGLGLDYYESYVVRDPRAKASLYSVRCVK